MQDRMLFVYNVKICLDKKEKEKKKGRKKKNYI